jgi:hypothetical protein
VSVTVEAHGSQPRQTTAPRGRADDPLLALRYVSHFNARTSELTRRRSDKPEQVPVSCVNLRSSDARPGGCSCFETAVILLGSEPRKEKEPALWCLTTAK